MKINTAKITVQCDTTAAMAKLERVSVALDAIITKAREHGIDLRAEVEVPEPEDGAA